MFWIVTNRAWEDAYITVTHARNAAEGLGLTHHPGEALTHGFTSAVSVLVPLAGELVSPGSGLTTLRLASLVAFIVAIYFASRICAKLGLSRPATAFALAYLAFDPLQVFYGMSGMETQIAVAAILAAGWFVAGPRYRVAAVAIGFAVLVRPDFLLFAACVPLLQARRHSVRAAAETMLIALLTVAPWIVFATAYYGSPVPQTIVAKSLTYMTYPDGLALASLAPLAQNVGALIRTFTPFFNDTLVFDAPLPFALAATVAATVWALVIIGSRRLARLFPEVAWFLLIYVIYRVLFLPRGYFDWYVPPFTALAIIAAACGIDHFEIPAIRRTAAYGLVAALAIPLVFTIGLERTIQQTIEDQVREPLGRYLGDVVPAGDPVALEAAGYFGYFSRATIYDFPGLTSRAALSVVRSLPRSDRNLMAMVTVMEPPWIVMRPGEYIDLQGRRPDLAATYRACRTFAVPGDETVGWGGLVKTTIDRSFTVYSRDGCGS